MPKHPKRSDLACPMVIRPFQPYRSVVTNKVIDDRSNRREEIAQAADKGLVPFERIDNRPPGLINDAFAKKGGRKTSQAAKEWAANKRAALPKLDSKGAIITDG